MATVAVINTQYCDKNSYCPAKENCPNDAIVKIPLSPDSAFFLYSVDGDKCNGCYLCVMACTQQAIELIPKK